MEKEFGPNTKKAAWLEGKVWGQEQYRLMVEIYQEPDPGVKGEVEFSLYSKFNGEPLKGFEWRSKMFRFILFKNRSFYH